MHDTALYTLYTQPETFPFQYSGVSIIFDPLGFNMAPPKNLWEVVSEKLKKIEDHS